MVAYWTVGQMVNRLLLLHAKIDLISPGYPRSSILQGEIVALKHHSQFQLFHFIVACLFIQDEDDDDYDDDDDEEEDEDDDEEDYTEDDETPRPPPKQQQQQQQKAVKYNMFQAQSATTGAAPRRK